MPMDLYHRYLTPEEIFGPGAKFTEPLDWLGAADQVTVLREVAGWQSKFDHLDLPDWKELERSWVAESIVEPLRSKILSLLIGQVTLVGPQALLILAKRALRSGHPSTLTDMRPLLMAAVAIQGGLDRERAVDETAEDRHLQLQVELIRSHSFHRRPDRGLRVAQSQIRWHDIPSRAGAELSPLVADAFEQVVGVSLLDFQSIGFLLFVQATEYPGATFRLADLAAAAHWDEARVVRAIAPMAATLAEASRAIAEDEARDGEAWTFDALRRFPVLRLDDERVLVLSPRLVLERTLGWLPVFDMTQPEQASGPIRGLAARAKGAFETVCEREVIETLAANVAGGRKHGRLFDGSVLRTTYPTGEIADGAIAYGDEWLVVEVSSGQLSRGTVVGGQQDKLEQDLGRLLDDKVSQIESTIAHIRADPARLSGDNRRRPHFRPVLVIAEGVPLNPTTHMTIMARLAADGRLTGAGIGPLHILDTEDLYVAEIVAETDRLGLNEILDQHAHSGRMRRMDLRSWLTVSGKVKKPFPRRLHMPFDQAVSSLNGNLGVDPEKIAAVRLEK